MSVYNFTPSPDLSTKEQNYAFWNDAFSDSEISRIRQMGDSANLQNSVLGVDLKVHDDIRKSKTAEFAFNDDTAFIYNNLAYVARQLNAQFFDFDISGFVEDIQYMVYDSGGDHYTWHMDKGNLNNPPRKLSMVMQLSDSDEYEGGDLEFMLGPDIIKAERTKGIIYMFPSWILHRVTPVTAGTRRSLVVWIAGPRFR